MRKRYPNTSYIQIIFIKRETHPSLSWPSTTSKLNGAKAILDIFRVCKPNGIPIIVTINNKLAKKYSITMNIPPKTNQMIFNRNFITISYLTAITSISTSPFLGNVFTATALRAG